MIGSAKGQKYVRLDKNGEEIEEIVTPSELELKKKYRAHDYLGEDADPIDHNETLDEKYERIRYSPFDRFKYKETMHLDNTRTHPFPPDLGTDRIEVQNSKIQPTPRIPYVNPKEEAKYQDALLKSWRRTHRLIGMDPDTLPPNFEVKSPAKDNLYSKHAVMSAVNYMQRLRFLFVQPTQDLEHFENLFIKMNNPVFEIIDDCGVRIMFAAETLEMLFRKIKNKKGCCKWKKYDPRDVAAFDRSSQPYELSFVGPDGLGIMHASRANTHDVTITDYYNEICYLLRSDNGKFPRHYNIIDAKAMVKICELKPPTHPDDEVLGNFDACINGVRIAKIRQGGWRSARFQERNVWKTRYGIHMAPGLNCELKAFLVVALLNAHFTFNITKEVEDKFDSDLKESNPEVWKSVFPNPDLSDPKKWDAYWLERSLYFSAPWYKDPVGVKRLSTGSIDIEPKDFFSPWMEENRVFAYKGSKEALPYKYKMNDHERTNAGLVNNDFEPISLLHTDENKKQRKKREKKTREAHAASVMSININEAKKDSKKEHWKKTKPSQSD